MRNAILPTLVAVLTLAGCSREFPETPLTSEEAIQHNKLVAQNDHDSRVEQGRLAFMHNHIDEAEALLKQAVKEEPQDMEAKAWLAANDCKIAGRAGPWLMGFDKLYGVWACQNDLKSAVEAAPDNFTVLMIQLTTDAEVDMFGSMDRAIETRDSLLKKIEAKPNAYPPSAKEAFFKAAIRIGELQNDPESIHDYSQRVLSLNVDKDSVQKAKESIQSR